MEILKFIIDFILHIDVHLGQLISTYGVLTNAILFIIIFIETGLVLTPFLPGDSLLFAAGAFAALGAFNIWLLVPLLFIAAILGDNTNYWIGYFLGQKMIDNPKIPIQQKHIDKTEEFFQKHGGKTIIYARFIPIVRTFAPFVAGIGTMSYSRFASYNIVGGVLWVVSFLFIGYFFGGLPVIKDNFTYVIFGIIILSILPPIIELVRERRKGPRPVVDAGPGRAAVQPSRSSARVLTGSAPGRPAGHQASPSSRSWISQWASKAAL